MNPDTLDWTKGGGLLPAIVQDAASGAVLMLAYMNAEALARTLATGQVTFWSRSKRRLWTKGETSGHFLDLVDVAADCDGDTLLVLAHPRGPACHTGATTCWGPAAPRATVEPLSFIARLDGIIQDRIARRPEGSYTTRLLEQGTRRIAQKVGEEGLELALASVTQTDQEVVGEAADLVYHMLLLLRVKGLSIAEVSVELEARHEAAAARDAGPA